MACYSWEGGSKLPVYRQDMPSERVRMVVCLAPLVSSSEIKRLGSCHLPDSHSQVPWPLQLFQERQRPGLAPGLAPDLVSCCCNANVGPVTFVTPESQYPSFTPPPIASPWSRNWMPIIVNWAAGWDG